MNQPPWLQGAFDRLEALIGGRLPHALLIQGREGWGEDHVANALAAKLLGFAAQTRMRDVAHPDLRWLDPEDGVLKIDAVRRVIEFLMQTPQLAGRKVGVICDAQRMNLNAANALLKTLEEPPAESFLVLVSGAPERLLPTVRSRCQRIDIGNADTGVIEWLEGQKVGRDAARDFAVEYAGAPFSILQAAQREQTPLWQMLVEAARSPAEIAGLAERCRSEDLADFAARWLRIVHQLARRASGGGALSGEAPGASRSQAWDAAPLLDFATELLEVRRAALFNTGLNRPMQLHRLLLLWAEIWPLLPTGAVPRLE